MRRGAVLAVAVGTTLFSARAVAEPVASAALAYDRGGVATCPEEMELRQAVATRLGYDPFVASAPRSVRVTISPTRGALRATVTLDEEGSSQGRRTLSSATSDCTELAGAVALAIAIALDPVKALAPPEPPPSVPPALAPPPAPSAPRETTAASPSPAPSPSSPSRPSLRSRVGAGLLAAYGLVPEVGVAPLVFAGVGRGLLSLDVEGRYVLPSSAGTSPSGRVAGSLLAGSLVPCARRGLGIGCAVVTVGRFAGQGSDVDFPREASAAFAAVGARLGVELSFGRLVAALFVESVAPLAPIRLTLRDREVWSSSVLTASAALAVGGAL